MSTFGEYIFQAALWAAGITWFLVTFVLPWLAIILVLKWIF
jgi:hypothetical protein